MADAKPVLKWTCGFKSRSDHLWGQMAKWQTRGLLFKGRVGSIPALAIMDTEEETPEDEEENLCTHAEPRSTCEICYLRYYDWID